MFSCFNDKGFLSGILIGLCKDFDTIDHSILLRNIRAL